MNIPPRYRILILAGFASLCATAYTAEITGTATTPSAPTTTTEPQQSKLPQTTAFTPEQVCQLLTSTEVKSLSLTSVGQPTELPNEPTCLWSGSDVNRVFLSVVAKPLSAIHPSPNDTTSNTEISGRPALVIEDFGQEGCGIYVELTATTTMSTQGGTSGHDPKAHCQFVQKAIEFALTKITK
jgi:uncharacterized protein DUF3558